MSNKTVDKLLQVMRDANGTPLEPVRNALAVAAGRSFDIAFGIQSWHAKTEIVHPLSHLIAGQVGDPFDRWNVSDIKAFRAHFEEMLDYLPKKVLCTTADRSFACDGFTTNSRVFTPKRPRTGMTVVFLHGGGFVLGDFDSNDPECDKIARALGRVVISIGYPLSPEHKFPVALECVRAALSSNGLVDEESFVLIGESAGANLALAAVQSDPALLKRCRGLVLAYPFLDLTLSGETVKEYESGFFLTKRLLEWFKGCYLEPDSDARDPRISPLFGDTFGLPPSLVVVGEFDPLRSDAIRFADKHPNARLEVFSGMIHGFLQLRGLSPARNRALDLIIDFIRSL